MNKQHKHISKLMSLVLRHRPAVIGVELDKNGWLGVDELIEGVNTKGLKLDRELLEEIVETNDKKRFAFSEDGTKIRANQGHSIKVDVELKEQVPPEFLYHGTVAKFMRAIQKEGLKSMSRQHVHLSEDLKTAMRVGSRRGVPKILVVKSGEMHTDGHTFYRSENGVWLTDHVAPKYFEERK